jgi:amidase
VVGALDIGWLDGVAQSALVRNRELTAAELVAASVARAEAINPSLNAIIHENYDAAVAGATRIEDSSPLAGVPMVVKDFVCREAGRPFHEGSQFLKAIGYVSEYDQELAIRFRRAGLVSIGRTNTSEFGMRPLCEPVAYGPTNNPWNLLHSPGGSSGGSAAAVAAGIVPIGHANDAGGSIRNPASMCGLIGLKPTRGRSCFAPDFGDVLNGIVEELAITRTVRDLAAVFDAVAGPSPGDWARSPDPPSMTDVIVRPVTQLRIGVAVPEQLPVQLHPAVRRTVDEATELVIELGHRVEPVTLAPLAEDISKLLFPHYSSGVAWIIDHHWPRILGTPIPEDQIEPGTARLADIGRAMSASGLLEARELAQAWCRRLAIAWDRAEIDVLVLPTLEIPPPLTGSLRPKDDAQLLSLVAPFNLSGHPAMSVPIGNHDELPIGIQLVANHHDEHLLFQLAAQLEQATTWAARRPSSTSSPIQSTI